MVNPEVEEVSSYPRYALERIHELADEGKVAYYSNKVETDANNLDYTHEMVCECLLHLTSAHFHRSILYFDETKWQDAYQITMRWPGEIKDDLYIKFQLNKPCTLIVLRSLHQTRYG